MNWPPPKAGDKMVYRCRGHYHIGMLWVPFDDEWCESSLRRRQYSLTGFVDLEDALAVLGRMLRDR